MSYGKKNQSGDILSNSAEGGVGNPQITGNVFQRSVQHHLRLFLNQTHITVPGRYRYHIQTPLFELEQTIGHPQSTPFRKTIDGMEKLLKYIVIDFPARGIF